MIDLKKIINQNPKALHDKSMLQDLLLQSDPNKKRSIRIIISFMECGIVNELLKISNKGINNLDQTKFIMKMYDEYGYDKKYTKPLLELWIDALEIKPIINKGSSSAEKKERASDGLDFHPLDKVYEKSWGEGIVLESKIEDYCEFVTVQFKSVGLRKIPAKAYKLENLTNPIDWEEREQRIHNTMKNWTF